MHGEHKLSEDGSNISGGEKARLEIARALTREPLLIWMRQLQHLIPRQKIVLKSVRKSCTGGIIISHRIEPVKICDEIIVLNKGKIEQRGTHLDLIQQKDGLYRKLFILEAAK